MYILADESVWQKRVFVDFLVTRLVNSYFYLFVSTICIPILNCKINRKYIIVYRGQNIYLNLLE